MLLTSSFCSLERLGMGFPGTGNTGPKTAGNREHQPQNSREQGTFIKNLGTREHWLKNGREQGTLALKAPGTGNIGLKTAGSREHSMKSCVGTTNPSMEERYMRYYVKFGCLQVQNSHLRAFKSLFTLDTFMFDLSCLNELFSFPYYWHWYSCCVSKLR